MNGLSSQLSRHLDHPRFRSPECRVVVLDSGYFTVAECRRGLERLGHQVYPIHPGDDFIRRLLNLLVTVRPDFLLAVNHLGFDEEGALTDLLTSLRLPYASWFVDSPEYILSGAAGQVSDYCTVFCWEKGYLERLSARGYREPRFLPLATDPEIFRPQEGPIPRSLTGDVAFVGSSMAEAMAIWRERVPEELAEAVGPEAVAAQLADRSRPMREILTALGATDDGPGFTTLEALMVWSATREYRHRVTSALAPLGLTVYGDPGWQDSLGGLAEIRPPVHYYRELPAVYSATRVNLNTTSCQMNSAVNQRVFDAAACGAFLLTDRQQDLELFFEPGRESVCYESPGEAAELAARYLGHDRERLAVAAAARARVLAEHTYDHRMSSLVTAMAQRYA
jgi:spore maturation protein CgeB